MARELGELLGFPVIHLDCIYWLPNWVNREKEDFDRLLEEKLNLKEWIIDGNYGRTLKKRLEVADLVIYLDYDTLFCLNSYHKRALNEGTRPDITEGCVETLDPEMDEYIQTFNQKYRGFNYQMIKEAHKPSLVFQNRDEKNKFIEKIKKNPNVDSLVNLKDYE